VGHRGELVAIGRAMLDQASYYLSDEAETAFREYLTLRMRQPRFANARSVRNETFAEDTVRAVSPEGEWT
jgi:hypothetical protein